MSFTKIRQYYEQVCVIYQLVSGGYSSDAEKSKSGIDDTIKENIKMKIKLLIVRAIYDFGRNDKKIMAEKFVYFLKINSELLDEDLENNIFIFKKHFEAIIAYARVYNHK